MEKPSSKQVYFFTWGEKVKKRKGKHKQKHQETDGKHNGESMEKPSSKQVYFFTWGEKVKSKT